MLHILILEERCRTRATRKGASATLLCRDEKGRKNICPRVARTRVRVSGAAANKSRQACPFGHWLCMSSQCCVPTGRSHITQRAPCAPSQMKDQTLLLIPDIQTVNHSRFNVPLKTCCFFVHVTHGLALPQHSFYVPYVLPHVVHKTLCLFGVTKQCSHNMGIRFEKTGHGNKLLSSRDSPLWAALVNPGGRWWIFSLTYPESSEQNRCWRKILDTTRRVPWVSVCVYVSSH